MRNRLRDPEPSQQSRSRHRLCWRRENQGDPEREADSRAPCRRRRNGGSLQSQRCPFCLWGCQTQLALLLEGAVDHRQRRAGGDAEPHLLFRQRQALGREGFESDADARLADVAWVHKDAVIDYETGDNSGLIRFTNGNVGILYRRSGASNGIEVVGSKDVFESDYRYLQQRKVGEAWPYWFAENKMSDLFPEEFFQGRRSA